MQNDAAKALIIINNVEFLYIVQFLNTFLKVKKQTFMLYFKCLKCFLSVSQSRANLHLPYRRQNQNMERRHQPKATESDYRAGEGAAHVETSTAAHLEIASTQTHE